MNERERKVIAFLLGIVTKLTYGCGINDNERKSLENLMDEFGTDDLDEKEFRY